MFWRFFEPRRAEEPQNEQPRISARDIDQYFDSLAQQARTVEQAIAIEQERNATHRAFMRQALAAELDDSEVLVSCIQPGLVKTGLHHRWEIGPEGVPGSGNSLEPEDFARMVLFILEQPEARHRMEKPDSAGPLESAADGASGESPAAVAKEAPEKPARTGDWEFAGEDGDNGSDEGFVQDEI